MAQITKEQLLEKIFQDDYEQLMGKKLRMTRVRIPGKEVCMAHIMTPTDTRIYQNLALHIGVHEGEDHTGETLGLIRFTPWEAVVVAADIAMKSADVQLCFMDRFCGSLIVSGGLSEVQTAVESVVRFFGEELGFVGTMTVIVLILLVIIECFYMGAHAPDIGGRIICCGVGGIIAFQSFVNMGVATRLLPNTGLPLPFVSYGLSSLLSLMIGMGVVMNLGLQHKKLF